MNRSRTGALLVLLATFVVTACDREETQPAPVVVDEPVAEGLTRDELRQQAESMTPEQAEQLGIIDTTIHVEQLAEPADTLLRADTVPRRDTLRP